jgi:hypothetical protein
MDSIFGGKGDPKSRRYVTYFPTRRLVDWLETQVTSGHAKLMLLEFPDRLRMVITSANMPRRFWEVGMDPKSSQKNKKISMTFEIDSHIWGIC